MKTSELFAIAMGNNKKVFTSPCGLDINDFANQLNSKAQLKPNYNGTGPFIRYEFQDYSAIVVAAMYGILKGPSSF